MRQAAKTDSNQREIAERLRAENKQLKELLADTAGMMAYMAAHGMEPYELSAKAHEIYKALGLD